MNIGRNDLVLEIGSGDNPKPRSDVLCDKLPEDDTQRGGKIVLDRPFIAADGQYLPFADKSFDYIISCHVLEHVEDPGLFLSELMRVGRRGYIETPSEIGEKLYGWPYHKWLVNLDRSNKLILKRKTEEGQFGQLFHYLFSNDRTYARFHTQNHSIFLIRYEWSGHIDYEIVDPGTPAFDLNDPKVLESIVRSKTKQTVPITFSFLPSQARRWAKAIIVRGRGRHRRTLKDVKDIIVCPLCKGQVQWHEDFISCGNCDRAYPIRDGIPFLLPQ